MKDTFEIGVCVWNVRKGEPAQDPNVDHADGGNITVTVANVLHSMGFLKWLQSESEGLRVCTREVSSSAAAVDR